MPSRQYWPRGPMGILKSTGTKHSLSGNACHFSPLCLAYVLSLGPAIIGRELELKRVSFTKRIKGDINEFLGVKEYIFLCSFDFDEAESLIGEGSYCSFLHS